MPLIQWIWQNLNSSGGSGGVPSNGFGAIQIDGKVTLANGSVRVSSSLIVTLTALGTRAVVDFAAGDNTIAVPAGATSIIITPPAGNTAAIILKGAATDVGRRLHNTRWIALNLDPSVTSLILNLSEAASGFEVVWI